MLFNIRTQWGGQEHKFWSQATWDQILAMRLYKLGQVTQPHTYRVNKSMHVRHAKPHPAPSRPWGFAVKSSRASKGPTIWPSPSPFLLHPLLLNLFSVSSTWVPGASHSGASVQAGGPFVSPPSLESCLNGTSSGASLLKLSHCYMLSTM